MAKIILFFKAPAGKKSALADAVHDEVREFWDQQKGCQSAAFMVAADNDPFRRATAPCVAKDVVVEIRAPYPSASLPLIQHWKNVATRLGPLLKPKDSVALLGHDRVFLPSAPQPVHYHYLMQRRADFTDADYYDHYVHFHSQYGLNTPGVAGYRQTYVDAAGSQALSTLTGLTGPASISVSELELPTIQGMLDGTRGRRTESMDDEFRFVDGARSIMFCSNVIQRFAA